MIKEHYFADEWLIFSEWDFIRYAEDYLDKHYNRQHKIKKFRDMMAGNLNHWIKMMVKSIVDSIKDEKKHEIAHKYEQTNKTVTKTILRYLLEINIY